MVLDTTPTGLKIEVVGIDSPHLSAVKSLGDANSKTLGFLPGAAFDACAATGTILAAVDHNDVCIGYLLYRVARGRASITHLCVDQSIRRSGVAKQLVNTLDNRTRDLAGIGLWCRRDYEAGGVWRRLGFAAMAEKPGRSKKGSELVFWWLDHHLPTLFTPTATEGQISRIPVVMDACVFFDLLTAHSVDTQESKALEADWLCESIELHLTDEIFNEIDRGKDARRKQKHRALASSFTKTKYDTRRFQEVRESLRGLFPVRMSHSDESDLHQVAKTIAADVPFLVTRAEDILNKVDKVYEDYGLTILRPADLIIELDQLRRENEYRPRRIAGCLRKIQRVKSGQETALASSFQCDSLGESRQHFIRELTACMSSPATFQCSAAYSEEGTPLALLAHGGSQSGRIEIPLFRVARGSLAPTMARYLAKHVILTACREKRPVVLITDRHVDQSVADALRESSFTHDDGRWTRAVLDVAAARDEIVLHLDSLKDTFGTEAGVFADLATKLRETTLSDVNKLAEFEALLWPAKILDADIPSFIIPIQPRWAKHLFDEHLASQELFGARADLALNCEAVYYRAKSLCGLTTPARILWYVSQHDDFSGTGSVRACSRLDEFLVQPPKDLYRQFRRLGVYEWPDVYGLAKKDVKNKIMAIRFSDTELLPSAISWREMQKILTAEGIRSQIQTVTRIPSKLFALLYARGKQ